MKQKEKTAIRSANDTELAKMRRETREHIEKTRINRYTKPSRNVREARELRKKLSFIQTVVREKELLSL